MSWNLLLKFIKIRQIGFTNRIVREQVCRQIKSTRFSHRQNPLNDNELQLIGGVSAVALPKIKEYKE